MKILRENTCSICGDTVDAPGPEVPGEGVVPKSPLLTKENRLQLNCGHMFHSFCLYGWCMIGKKDICPYCKERLDLQVFQVNPYPLLAA